MWHKYLFAAIAVAGLSGVAVADPWKDEYGRWRMDEVRRWQQSQSPGWTRGNGYGGIRLAPDRWTAVPALDALPREPAWSQPLIVVDEWGNIIYYEDRSAWQKDRLERDRESNERSWERLRDWNGRFRDW